MTEATQAVLSTIASPLPRLPVVYYAQLLPWKCVRRKTFSLNIRERERVPTFDRETVRYVDREVNVLERKKLEEDVDLRREKLHFCGQDGHVRERESFGLKGRQPRRHRHSVD